MKGLCLGVLIACVLGLAVWAYSENYTTQQSLSQVDAINRDIATARARLRVLNAEWAWLNRPERLSELARLNFEALQLLHMNPDHFADIDAIPMAPQVHGITDTMAQDGGNP